MDKSGILGSNKGRGCDQIMRVGFTLLDLFPDITDRTSSI